MLVLFKIFEHVYFKYLVIYVSCGCLMCIGFDASWILLNTYQIFRGSVGFIKSGSYEFLLGKHFKSTSWIF